MVMPRIKGSRFLVILAVLSGSIFIMMAQRTAPPQAERLEYSVEYMIDPTNPKRVEALLNSKSDLGWRYQNHFHFVGTGADSGTFIFVRSVK